MTKGRKQFMTRSIRAVKKTEQTNQLEKLWSIFVRKKWRDQILLASFVDVYDFQNLFSK